MPGIYIASTSAKAGKSLLCLSLGVLLQRAGHSVGYCKPLGAIPKTVEERLGDEDALVVQEVLGQDAPADVLTPLMAPRNPRELQIYDSTTRGGALERIQSAYGQISQGRDLTLVSGSGIFPSAGSFAGAGGKALVDALNLKVVLVVRLDAPFAYDALLHCRDLLGPSLLGVVLNDVRDNDRRDAEEVLVPWLTAHSMPVLGLIPGRPSLWAIRAGDLAPVLGGRLTAGNAGAGRVVEGFIVGAMQVENFMTHLRRLPRRAVIVGGDRADLQLAALNADAPCVILTGNLGPAELVRQKAENLDIPLLTVRDDTFTTAQAMAGILNDIKLRELHRIRQALDLAATSLDLSVFTAAFGLDPNKG